MARTKLGAERRASMVKMFKAKTHTKKELAEHFECSISTVSNIVNPTKAKKRRHATIGTRPITPAAMKVLGIIKHEGVSCALVPLAEFA